MKGPPRGLPELRWKEALDEDKRNCLIQWRPDDIPEELAIGMVRNIPLWNAYTVMRAADHMIPWAVPVENVDLSMSRNLAFSTRPGWKDNACPYWTRDTAVLHRLVGGGIKLHRKPIVQAWNTTVWLIWGPTDPTQIIEIIEAEVVLTQLAL